MFLVMRLDLMRTDGTRDGMDVVRILYFNLKKVKKYIPGLAASRPSRGKSAAPYGAA